MHIVKTGAANLASVVAAFDRLGVKAVLTTDPADVWKAERLVLPGVGAFGAAMASLRAAGLVTPLRDRLLAGKPTLAICLGLQLLAETSQESQGATGLGVIPGRVTRFAQTPGLTVPQMGWNAIRATPGAALLRDGWAYYANSFKLDAVPPGWSGATSDYGAPFVAALERGAVLACQFHPELSGPGGLALIGRWLQRRPDLSESSSEGPGLRGPTGTPLTRIIPCLDVRDGRVVKGVKFQNLRDAGDPAAQAAEYERQGADELVMLDVSATPEGRKTAGDTVRAIRRVLSVPLTVGGGVRTVDDAARLLDAGADKVGVNTAAVERPALIAELAEKFGRQCVVLAVDAARTVEFGVDRLAHPKARPSGMSEPAVGVLGAAHLEREGLTPAVWWEVVVHSGKTRTGLDAVAWAERGAEHGAGEVLLTSYDRDGTGEGYDLDLLRAVCGAVQVPVIASGGARTAEHLAAAVGAGASAVLAASIFHDGVHTVGAVKSELTRLGAAVRTEPT